MLDVGARITSANQKWIDAPGDEDDGIDMLVEFTDEDGNGIGKGLCLQLKASNSHLTKRKDGTEIFTIKKQRWVKTWTNQSHPVMLVIGTFPEKDEGGARGANLGLGCGNPQAIAALPPGETVLDLGTGAGFDSFLVARAVGRRVGWSGGHDAGDRTGAHRWKGRRGGRGVSGLARAPRSRQIDRATGGFQRFTWSAEDSPPEQPMKPLRIEKLEAAKPGPNFMSVFRPSWFLVLVALVLPGRLSAQSATKPNIILIMADDLGYGSLGCYGSTEIKTPNIDRLAAGGMRFTDFHSNGPVCSPTRAALLTGRYPQRCAWVGDEELSPVFREQRQQNPGQRWAWGIATNEVTIAGLLREAGYRSGLIGKWHLGYDFKFHPLNYGFDEFRGFVGGNVDYHTHVAGYGLKQLDWWNGKQLANEEGYATDLLTTHATDFIARHKDRPFFLYLAHAAPHEPWQGRDPRKKAAPAATYTEMIQILDESVGAVVAALRKHGLEQKTLLIFCSDNGAAAPGGVSANGQLQGRKGSMSEGGHRVPCIASWPGVIVAGAVHEQTVMTMDFFPTFAKLAGVAPPGTHQIDGRDLMPLMKNDTKKIDRVLHWLYGGSWAVRKGAWKLSGKGEKPLTLVNLEKDLEEKSNLIQEQPELIEELMTLHRQWIESVGNK